MSAGWEKVNTVSERVNDRRMHEGVSRSDKEKIDKRMEYMSLNEVAKNEAEEAEGNVCANMYMSKKVRDKKITGGREIEKEYIKE